jgi:uncharacterized membrane protein
MKKTVCLRAGSLAKQLTFTAVFAALCCVATCLIAIPLPNGYFNTGDVFVLLAGWCLGPLFGGVAAATGSALADVLTGYALYAPATFIIKGLDAIVAYYVYQIIKKLIKNEKVDFIPRAFSAILGELLMVSGYCLFEIYLYGVGGALASVVGNLLQGGCCALCAVLLMTALYSVSAVRKFFPHLSNLEN